jgi:hypothetical protein
MSASSISDHIGRIGEDEFQRLANKAKLIIAKPDPDRIGVDRIVEFDPDTSISGTSHDKKPPAISCLFQIKTVLHSTNRIHLSLSVANRLAKDPKPCFICVMKLDKNENISDIRFIHIINENISHILKRLREESLKKNTKIHLSKIYFDISKGTPSGLDHVSFRSTIAAMIPSDMNSYAIDKINQCKTIGYDEKNRYKINITFDGYTQSDISEALIGKKTLRATSLSTHETRFDITLPDAILHESGGSEGTVSFTPTFEKKAVLIIENKLTEERASTKVNVTFGAFPGIDIENMHWLLKNDFLDIVIGNNKLNVTSAGPLNELTDRPLREWMEVFTFWHVFGDGEVSIKIMSDDGMTLRTGSAKLESLDNSKYIDGTLKVIQKLCVIHKDNMKSDINYNIKDIVDSAKRILDIFDFVDARTDKSISFEFLAPTEESILSDILKPRLDSLYFGRRIVCGIQTAYAAKINITGEKVGEIVKFSSNTITPLQVSCIDKGDDEYNEFISLVETISGINMKMISDDE